MTKTGSQTAVDSSLEQWINTRQDWLRRAASQLIAVPRLPTDQEIHDLADHCHCEAAGQLAPKTPPIADGAVANTPTAGALRIEKVVNILGVNALGPSAELRLGQGAVSVIYGSNGSGKTGYARLLKEMCGARIRDKEIFPNVFVGQSVPPSATVILSVNGANEKPINWKLSDKPIPKLGSVQIFDTSSATQFCDSTSPATHEPRTMRFLGVLIHISDRLAENLRKRREALVSKLPALPAAFQTTKAGTFYQNIKATTTAADVDEACKITEDDAKERMALEAALAQADPAARLTTVGQELGRIEGLRIFVTSLQNQLADERIQALFNLRAMAVQKRNAAREYAERFFAGVPLPGVGDATWRELWSHAQKYSEEVAYPGHTHPALEEGARCVLCQQVLSNEARGRLKSFSDFLTNALESEAVATENTLSLEEEKLPKPPASEQWNAIGVAVALPAEALVKVEAEVKARIDALTQNLPQADIPPVDWSGTHAAIVATVERLQTERTNLQAIADPAGRAKQEARLFELKAREWIVTVRDPILEEAKRKQQINILEKAITSAGTSALTQKINEIGALELAGGYKERFNLELDRLRGGLLPVRLEHKKEGKGKFTFYIELKDVKARIPSRAVLSEGEQRVVALASFLADVTSNDRATPIIFDDPISSLDQTFEEAVAKRLVMLAKTRQVIVFTHRLSFMTLIDDAQDKLREAGDPVTFHVEVIQRQDEATGVPSTLDVFSEKPMGGLNKLIAAIQELKKLDLSFQPLVIKGICSNFRIVLERIVENHLCAGVILRFRRDVQTTNRLAKLAAITPADCQLIDGMMTKYSAFEHSQASEIPGTLPSQPELLADVENVKTWLGEFLERIKKTFP